MSLSAVRLEKYTFNKGEFLSAKICSDVKSNICSCGGKFSKFELIKEYEIPCCDSCGEHPDKFRIRAKVKNLSGSIKRIEIRYDQNGDRLTDFVDCLTTIKYIKLEIKKGIFDVRKYEAKKSKVMFEFDRFIELQYPPYHLRRYQNKELTKSGYRHKVGSCKKLVSFYDKMDISTFKTSHIEAFRKKYEGTSSTINYLLNDLRTILKYAVDIDYLTTLPNFGRIKTSNKRKVAMSYDKAKEVVSNIDNKKYQDILKLALIYPVRPSEILTLRWNDIDFVKGTIRFDEHLSDGELTSGRKSRNINDRYGTLLLPLSHTAKNILRDQVISLNGEDFIFKSKYNNTNIKMRTIQRAWNDAKNKVSIDPIKDGDAKMYEIKHAVLSRLYESTNKNLKTMEKMSGVNINTLMDRYVYSNDDLSQYVQ